VAVQFESCSVRPSVRPVRNVRAPWFSQPVSTSAFLACFACSRACGVACENVFGIDATVQYI